MKRKSLLIVLVMLMVFAAGQVFAEYNREVVVDAMRTNGALMGKLKTALAENHHFDAAEALRGIAQAEKTLISQVPPKGSKAEWDRIHNEIISAAFKGIGAIGDKDMDKVNVHVGEIGALIQQGHTTFR